MDFLFSVQRAAQEAADEEGRAGRKALQSNGAWHGKQREEANVPFPECSLFIKRDRPDGYEAIGRPFT